MITLVTAALLAAQSPSASVSTITGIVYDEHRSTIPDAAVQISCGTVRREVRATASGEFVAEGLPTGPCTIDATAPLFERASTRITLTRNVNLALVLRIRAVEAEVTVSARRGVVEDGFDVPRAVSTTTRTDIDARPYQLLAQVLREEAGVLVQQTTSAQTSPIIRGFTGQSNVYLLDGVRLNTSSWRTGPVQYLSWVDPEAVERIDIVRGPGSVQYGSDALGGTINVLTSAPSFSASGVQVGGDVNAMLASADLGRNGAVNATVQAPAAAFRFGLGMRDVGDLRAGRGRDSHAAVTRFLGLESTAIDNRLRDTGFDQSGGYLVGNIRAGNRATINTVYMHQDQSGASRYDRIFGGDGLYDSGFDPQTLDFLSVRYRRQGVAGFNEFSATASLNRQADGRFEQTRPTAVVDAQRAVTKSYGYQMDAQRRIGPAHRLGIGVELYDEGITASREQRNPLTNAVQALRPDIPDGTNYRTFGAFVQDTADIFAGRLTLQGGLRYGRYAFSTTPDAAFGVTAEEVVSNAVTFEAGAVAALSRQVHLTFAVSRGFRAANASDFGTIGLTGGGGFEIAPVTAAQLGGLVGSTAATGAVSTGLSIPALGPEVTYAYEPGIKFQGERFSAWLVGFDIEYGNAIQRRAIVFPAGIVGSTISGFTVVRQDATGLGYIAQDQRPIATRVNIDRARLRGFEAEGTYRLSGGWRARAFYGMTNGRLSTGEYMRRMAPPLGGVSLRWSTSDDARWVEGIVTFAGEQNRLNPGDLTDARIGGSRSRAAIASYFTGTASDLGLVANGVLLATGETLAEVQNRVLGTAASAPLFDSQPAFVVFGLRGGWRLTSAVGLTLIGENLTDRNYRLYGSGVDAPGANVQLRLRYRF